jgi:hypothetical protein
VIGGCGAADAPGVRVVVAGLGGDRGVDGVEDLGVGQVAEAVGAGGPDGPDDLLFGVVDQVAEGLDRSVDVDRGQLLQEVTVLAGDLGDRVEVGAGLSVVAGQGGVADGGVQGGQGGVADAEAGQDLLTRLGGIGSSLAGVGWCCSPGWVGRVIRGGRGR